MYRQIKINPAHTHLLNILWRENSKEPLTCVQLSTVTYGTNCAPFLATRVLNDIALKNKSNYPLASQALLNQTYVDDILSGCDNRQDLKKLYTELNSVLNSAGLKLHKWCSNYQDFSKAVSNGSNLEYDIAPDETLNKVLGLKWNPVEDILRISIPNFTLDVVGKLLIQTLWSLKLDWDKELSDEPIINRWKTFVETLPLLTNLNIPRYLFCDKIIQKCQIHGFADSSMKAYAVCVYIRTEYSDGSITCNLISSKSRVAPLKVISLPRLEFCAMPLLSKLITQLLTIFENKIAIESVNLWTDSQIALCWINSHASRWTIFVANRVSQIQSLTSTFKWRHVKSASNPADIPSRGIQPQDILNCDLWWHGPPFLSNNNDFESFQCEASIEIPALPDEKKISLVVSKITEQDAFWESIFNKFSTFAKLQRSVAYCIRFAHNSKNKIEKTIGPLTVKELQLALSLILKNIQAQHFSKKVSELKNNKPLSNKSLLSLNPIYELSYGFLRVGGRLENAEISFNQKHPILLPSHNYVVSLMLKQEHKRLGHAGAQTVLSNFRLKFWPLNGLREVKRIIRNCIPCYRFVAQPAQQLMADLPKDRVTISRPFSRTSVDYGGPFMIKASNLRKTPLIKVYIAVFVCMVTKAIHIELVTGLSTASYLLTLKRFISRRGNPSKIYSDNATNFLGAKNHLKDLYHLFKTSSATDAIKEFCSQTQIEFKFIPPRSPHWGGLWESAIKSAQYHMRRLIGNSNFTYEEFYTILTQIEAVLNSRPLRTLSNDPNDFQFLTPGHFLIGTSLTAYPDRNLIDIPENRLVVWEKNNRIQQTFWKRWSVDYLNRLQNRPKWFQVSKNLEVNDLVLLKEDDTPPLKWQLGRISEIMASKDNTVRVVKVKTPQGTFTRSIVKICSLPKQDEI